MSLNNNYCNTKTVPYKLHQGQAVIRSNLTAGMASSGLDRSAAWRHSHALNGG